MAHSFITAHKFSKYLVITGSTESEIQAKMLNQALEDLEEDVLKFADAPGTQRNNKCKQQKYLQYCSRAKLLPYPVDETRLVRYAIYLSFTMQTVDSIKAYCSSVCDEHEMKGFQPVRRGKRFYKTIRSLRRILKHEVQHAKPITVQMLKKIVWLVDVTDQKQLATWVSLLFGFFLFLRKSNLVLETRLHDRFHQLSRQDLKIDGDLLIVTIKWSKTIQFAQRKLQLPLILDRSSIICPIRWLLVMLQRIPANGSHNLFSFTDGGFVYPITYRDLTVQMRKWLKQIGIQDSKAYSSHSLRRGGITHAFENDIPENTIKILGDWASDAYKRYIDFTVETRLKAWFLIPK